MADRTSSPSSFPLTIGELIRCRREALGLSRDELAQRIGPAMNRGDLYQLETARVLMPSWTRLLLIADALDLSIDQLRTDSDGCFTLVAQVGASARVSDVDALGSEQSRRAANWNR